MLKSLKIKNFRCFEEFDLPQLGRVNLLVGKNNSGKTSVLEAIHILDSVSLIPFWKAIERRGEHLGYSKGLLPGMSSGMPREIEDIDNIKHFCLGHEFLTTKVISICGDVVDGNNLFELTWPEERHYDSENFIIEIMTSNIEERQAIFKWSSIDKNNKVKSSHEIKSGVERDRYMRKDWQNTSDTNHSSFISFASTNIQHTIRLFEQIEMTPQESILLDALRFIEPQIERIASITSKNRGQKGGFKVAINGKIVPIGSMGDGLWWILEITLAMVNTPGGTLLIDEIDTGLHFSVMMDLWKLICKTAEKLDIQVFATTHNSDCWKSLAEVANSDDIASEDITIHRIERGKKASIVFNEQEMAIASERDIEVR
jgi:predicted ATP-dependent endonuclease of OLD family